MEQEQGQPLQHKPLTDEQLLSLIRDPEATEEDLALLTDQELARLEELSNPKPGRGPLFSKPGEGPPGGFGGRPADLSSVSGDDVLNVMGKLLSLGGGMLPALSANPLINIAARTAAVTPGGALSGWASNPEDRTKGALEGAGEQALMEGGFGVAGEAIPRAGFSAAMRLGGIKGNTREAVGAFMRERRRRLTEQLSLGKWERGERTGIPHPPATITVGAKERGERGLISVGKDIQKAEENAPGTVKLGVGRGSARDNVVARSETTSDPVGLDKAVDSEENKFFLSQGKKRTGLRRISHKKANDLDLSRREAAQLGRGQIEEGKDVLRKMNAGDSPLDISTTGIARSRLARGLKFKEEAQRGIPGIGDLNSRAVDLHNIDETNDLLRRGGGVLTDISAMGIRGGLGSGTARSLAGLVGQQGGPSSALGGILGQIFLAPRMLSGTSSLIGEAAEATPSTLRGLDAARELERMFSEFQEDPTGDKRKKRRAHRRRPFERLF